MENMKKNDRIGEITLNDDDVSNGAGQNEHMEVNSSDSSMIKRRKVDSPDSLHSPPSLNSQLEIECRRVLNCSLSPVESENSEQVASSLCSNSDAVKGSLSKSDPKEEGFVTDVSKFSKDGFSRETTPTSEISVDSERMESSTPMKKPVSDNSSSKQTVPSKVPSAMEIEEFFSVAEKYEQKRFADKYNYDIVKDVPLEGRYQWVKLKP